MKKKFFLVIFSILFLFPSKITADILYLKNGRKIDGKIVEKNEKGVLLKIAGGTIDFSHQEIERIESSQMPVDEIFSPKEIYLKQKKEIDPSDPEAHFKLGEYCYTHNLLDDAFFEFEEAIGLDKSYLKKTEEYRKFLKQKEAIDCLNNVIDLNNSGKYELAKIRLDEIRKNFSKFYEKNKLEKFNIVLERNLMTARYEGKLREAISDKARERGFFQTDTTNFKIFADNEKSAKLMAKKIEDLRDEVAKKLGFTFLRKWAVPCKLYIYSDLSKFLEDSGAPAWASGWQKIFFKVTQKIVGDAVLFEVLVSERRIMVYEETTMFISKATAHELGHMIFLEFIDGKSIPLWFNEGIAVCAQRIRPLNERNLLKKIKNNDSYKVVNLLEIKEYPEDQTIFYAQSANIVKFLLEECGAFNFIKLAKRIKSGEDFYAAFYDVYRGYFRDALSLEDAWVKYVEKKAKYEFKL